jgi:hypothetical protein
MCDHPAGSSTPLFFGQPSQMDKPGVVKGSRRRRLWDLPHVCYCPVVGVCLPLDTLRRLVNKALGAQAVADDYEVHVGAVAECGYRNRVSELLQAELDKRYSRDVQTLRCAKTSAAVADAWAQAVRQGDVAGTLWAALTHPRCDAVLEEVLLHDMHMLQHQAGASVRLDISKYKAVMHENAVLARELGRVQERSTRLITEKAGEVERLGALLVQARADNMGKDSRIAFVSEDLAALRASIPEYESGARLLKKIEQMAARQTELEGLNMGLRQKLAATTKSLEALAGEAAQAAGAALAERESPAAPVSVDLQQKKVLCVGGRTGSLASYRDVVERVGGRFAHHDGGLEDSQNILDASLVAADLVICQTGCISHNAYWKVKDFCKRTGKQCVFVENPSASSLARGLEQISGTTGSGEGTPATVVAI